jgi:hypothetical protein
MSTRCQVQVVAGGSCAGHEDEKITLYHHWDGYPSNMVPLLASAFKPAASKGIADAQNWMLGRPAKAAAFICAVDAGGFEPESGHALHGDIEWFYRVKVTTEAWVVDVYSADGFDLEPEELRLVAKNVPLDAEAGAAGEKIEEEDQEKGDVSTSSASGASSSGSSAGSGAGSSG